MAKRGSALWLYITAERVKEFGKTKGCPACRGAGGLHTEVCRKRITALVEKKEKKESAEAAANPGTNFVYGSRVQKPTESGASSSTDPQLPKESEQGSRGLKQRRCEDDGMEKEELSKEPEPKQPKIRGWDDEADVEMIWLMMDVTDKQMMAAILAVLDEDLELDEEYALHQPMSINPKMVK